MGLLGERAPTAKGPDMNTLDLLKTWSERNPELAAMYESGQEAPAKARRAAVNTDTIDVAAHEARFAGLRRLRGIETTEEDAALAFVTETPAVPEPKAEEGATTLEQVRTGGSFISEPQAKWILDILAKRELPEVTVKSTRVRLAQGLAKFAGIQFITNYKSAPLKAQPVAPKTAPAAAVETPSAEVPDGRYAIQMDDQDKPHFYSVKHGWKPGVIFVDEQASDDRYPVRNRAARERILAEIAKGPEAAGLAYARLLGRCRRCDRTLTDHNNPYFAMGLGPECGKK
jgi:hypothetical protein